MKVSLGIDPGKTGALAVFMGDRLVGYEDMPTLEVKVGRRMLGRVSAVQLAGILKAYEMTTFDHAFLEKVASMPKQSPNSSFTFGESVGMVKGVLAGMEIPVTEITPQKWRQINGVKQGKDGSRARAVELWPDKAGWFARRKDDGRAEAALIGRAGLMMRSVT